MHRKQTRRQTSPRKTSLASRAGRPLETLEPRRLFNATYFALAGGPLTQNWENAGLLVTNNDWSLVPSIEGFSGTGLASGPGVDPQTIVAPDSPGTQQVTVNQTNPSTFGTGGPAEFALTAAIPTTTPNTGLNTVALQGSGTSRIPYLKLYVNSTSTSAVRVQYDLIDIDGGVPGSTSTQQFALQYRVGGTGNFINVPAGYVANAADQATGAVGMRTSIDATLPAEAAGQANLEIRILTSDGAGSDQEVAVDNIVVSSTTSPTGPGTLAFNPTAYTFGEAAGTVNLTVSRTGGTTGAVSATYTLVNGTAVGGSDFTAATGTVTFAAGVDTATIPVTILDDAAVESTENFTVTLTAPTGGATLGTAATATVNITDNDVAVAGTLAFNPVAYTVNEAAGTISLTVKRTTGTNGAVSATYTTVNGSGVTGAVSPGDFTGGTGTVSFADGVDTATIVIPIINDTLAETAETFTVVLSAPTGGAVLGTTNTTATVTITDNDTVAPTGLLINEVYVDPTGTNAPYQFIEIKGTPGTVLSEVYVLAIEGDSPSNPGTLDGIINLNGATIGSNGLLVVVASVGGFDPTIFNPATGVFGTPFFNASGAGAVNFETGSNSYLLVFHDATGAALPAVGTDLDADNVQVQDLSQNLGLEGLVSVSIFDAIGATDGGASDVVYGTQLAAPATSASIDAIERFDGTNATLNAANFYYGALTGTNAPTAPNQFVTDSAALSANFPVGGAVTPGNLNVPSATGDSIPPTVVGASFNAQAGQRVVVTFSEDVRNTANGITASDFTLTNTTTNTTVNLVVNSISGDGKTVTLGFANTGGITDAILRDGNYTITVLAGQVADLAGNALVANSSSTFRFLNADFDVDGSVGFPDLLALAQSYSPGTTGRTFAQGDANYDGIVNFDDLLALAQRYGNSGGLTAAMMASITGETVKPAAVAAPRKDAVTTADLVASASPVKAGTFASSKRIA